MPKYPNGGYRNGDAKMLSMSSRDSATRLQTKIQERTFIGPRDMGVLSRQRVLTRQRDVDLRTQTRGMGKTISIPINNRSIGGYDGTQTLENSPPWWERENYKLNPKTIELSRDEYREIKERAGGDWRRAFRAAYRFVRRRAFRLSRDMRLEIVGQILDLVFADALAEGQTGISAGVTWPPGWTLSPVCPDVAPQFVSGLVYFGGCLANQAGTGLPGLPMGSSVVVQRSRVTGAYMLGAGVWFAQQNGRASHHQSGNSPWLPAPEPAGPHPGPVVTQPFLARGVRAYTFTKTSSARPGGPSNVRPGTKTAYKDPIKPIKNKTDKKFIIAFNTATTLGRVVNAVTEGIDFIDVVYGALGTKGPAKTPQDKINQIVKNWHTMNWGKFVQDYIKMQATDAFYGRIGRISANAARRANRSTGFQLGDWDTAGGQTSRYIEFTSDGED